MDIKQYILMIGRGRDRAFIRNGLLALVLPIYLIFAFFPFQWDPPRHITNHAHYFAGGGIRFTGDGIALSKTAPNWLRKAIRTNRLTIMLRILPLAGRQHGPARIMTLSRDPQHGDFTVAQNRHNLVFSLRAPWTNSEGQLSVRVLNIFQTRTWTNIRIEIRSNIIQIAVGGTVRKRKKLMHEPLPTWNPTYRLALGNEMTFNRAWHGEIDRARVRVGRMSVDYAQKSQLQVPSYFWYFHRQPILIPSWHMKPRGVVLNIVGFLPLGILLGSRAREHKGRYSTALGLIALFSATLESLQLCFAHRYPSINDLILNTLGGGCGIFLAHWLLHLLGKLHRYYRSK